MNILLSSKPILAERTAEAAFAIDDAQVARAKAHEVRAFIALDRADWLAGMCLAMNTLVWRPVISPEARMRKPRGGRRSTAYRPALTSARVMVATACQHLLAQRFMWAFFVVMMMKFVKSMLLAGMVGRSRA